MLNELTRNDVGPETVPTTGTGLAPISPYSSDLLVRAGDRERGPAQQRAQHEGSDGPAAQAQSGTACRTTVGKPVMM